MNDTLILSAMSASQLQATLQEMGYRVTVSGQDGQVQLLSAAQGIGFSVRPGNPAPAEGEFVDYTCACVLRLQGGLPEALVGDWNTGKRFSRLSRQGDFLVLEMDVVLAGGVTSAYVRAMAELWDRLLQEFVLFLRQYAVADAAPATLADADTADLAAAR